MLHCDVNTLETKHLTVSHSPALCVITDFVCFIDSQSNCALLVARFVNRENHVIQHQSSGSNPVSVRLNDLCEMFCK